MTNEEESQRKYMEYQFLMQHTQQVAQQLEEIKSQISELENINISLEEINKTENNQEILVPLGSGIFTKAKFVKDKEVLMNVGADVVVTKEIKDAKKLIDAQKEELIKFIANMENQLSLLVSHMQLLQKDLN